ncbi:Polycystic kidney disease 2-like 1 protein [Stylophora pistillata]|uniref:Polycystic kidney disease 2-like 1 protein n=1 Tax=Stylophora pistillata TaxID=50429 RepID=A0A2B4R6T8_STYPI|nr:Polycystic kidney disease 2-like 1 protein [Stylophora pistillata]
MDSGSMFREFRPRKRSLPVVDLKIKPTTDNAIFKVFVRHGQRPTVTEHDVSKQIPHPSCLMASQDSYSHCRNEAYDILLLPDELNKPGQYYIGIQYEKGEGELQSRRKKRSCSGRGRQKRSCVEVKEPLRPENITVKPVYDPKTDVNYSMNLLEESCLFWDGIEERWLSRGCKAEDPRYFWKWLDVEFVEGVYVSDWYNNDKIKQQEYIGNKMSVLLGMPRLRQLRIQKDSCIVPRIVQGIIHRGCYDHYSFNEEDKNPVNLPGWRPFSGSVEWANFSDLCPAPWQYAPSKKLHDSPSWGYFDVYDGGGYVADLGYNRSTAQAAISNLIEYGWIDQQTRAVLLEFTIYSPYTGYLIISAYHYEILPTGYGYPFPKIDTLQLTSTETGFYEFYLICQFLFIMMAFVFLLKEIYKLYRTKWTYFRDVWNWVEILQIISSVLVVVFYILKSNLIFKLAAMVKKNPFAFVSFGEAVSWSHTETTVLAIAVFLTTLKLLHIIRFNPHVFIMMSSFRVSKSLLLSYSMIFVIIVVSYAQMGMLVFGDHIQAILNDSFEDVKSNTDKQFKEFEMADFILERVSELLGINKRGQDSCQNDSLREDDTASAKSQDHSNLPLQRQNAGQNYSMREDDTASTKSQDHSNLPLQQRQNAGQNDTMREDETASTNAQDRYNLPLQKTLEGIDSKFDETLSTKGKRKLIPKSLSEHLAAKLELEKSSGPKSSKRTLETIKKDSSSEFDLDSSLEHLFDRIGVLTNNLATEDQRQDVKLLYVISQLSLKKNHETSCQGTLSTPHQMEEPSSATITSQDNIEKNRNRGSKNSSEDEIMRFIRRRSTRDLPIHLKIGSFYQQLQNDKTGDIAIFNNYSPKWRWLVVDIYQAAKRRGKYPPLTTDTEEYETVSSKKRESSLLAKSARDVFHPHGNRLEKRAVLSSEVTALADAVTRTPNEIDSA